MRLKARIKARNEAEAINNAINQGLMKNPADYRYLYTKHYALDDEWHDIFINLNTNYQESVKVEQWISEEEEE
tara:strand:- start:5447 stop:5665 length:219 start_codon:yes stop_codon:yes gene_type:complete